MANRDALIIELETTFLTAPSKEWVTRLLEVGIPAGPINDYAEALGNEHARVRDVVMELDHPVEAKFHSIGFPVKLGGTPQQVRRHPPLLGEHTAEILCELGMEDDAGKICEDPA